MNDQSPKSIKQYVLDANRHLNNAGLNKQVGTGSSRFEVYQFGLSVCSQKVRMTLFEKGAAFNSHDLDLFQNYQPDYVRLRMQGGKGLELVGGYTGRSSTRTEGFDPCVVPTVVDLETNEVLVDSQAICAHINRVHDSGIDLIPAKLKPAIEDEIAIADSAPQVSILYGSHPDGDFRPEKLKKNMQGIHDRKIMKLMEGRSLAVAHPRLVAAYDAKIKKEAAAKSFVSTPDMMRGSVNEIIAMVASLDDRLSDEREWICGDAFTMADIQWAISLFRFKWLGMAFLWEGNHNLNTTAWLHVERYAKRLFARPGFVQAVTAWPTNPPSEYVMNHYQAASETDSAKSTSKVANAHGRDIREENLTDVVLRTMAGSQNPRAKKVLNAFTRHLHAFVAEVEPTEEEWEHAIEFLTKTGHLSTGGRQEFVLLSDVMGVTARVDMINHRFPAGATENSVLGPFFVEDREAFDNGQDISGGIKGDPMFFNARVLDTDGKPIMGARVDVWHSDDEGHYDIMMPGLDGLAMRGLFRSDDLGRIWFTSVLPTSYPIPDDGTIGQLMRAANRSVMRPGHVHVRIEAPGYERLTTMLFVDEDPYLDSDPVFGVKQSLVMPFELKPGERAPDGKAIPDNTYCVDYDFVLARKR